MEHKEVYDWRADEREFVSSSELVQRASTSVNPVNGHGRGCVCPQCPGWYQQRAEMAARAVAGTDVSAPTERRPNPLIDQVVPVSILMAMVTVCGLVLLPVLVPLMAISALLIVSVSVVVVSGSVAVVYLVSAMQKTPTGNTAQRRWRRP